MAKIGKLEEKRAREWRLLGIWGVSVFNAGVSSRKYRSPKARSGGGDVFFWVMLGLIAVVGAWILQANRKSANRTTTPPPATVQNQPPPTPPPARPIVAPATNRPVASVAPLPAATNPPPVQKPVIVPVVTNAPRPVEIARTNPPPATLSGFPRPPRDVFEAQVALARLGISSGSLDGVTGSQTRAALLAFQQMKSLPRTGLLDADTKAQLLVASPPLITYVVTTADVARLQPLSKTWRGKAQQTALDYETVLELVAEKGRASPNLVKRLNPGIDWTNVVAGAEIKIPDSTNALPAAKAAFAAIKLSEKNLEVFDAATNLLAHFPCSIAARFDKRPVGELHVKAIAPNPDYTFNPEVFPESEEAKQIKTKLILPPGPNNPVGTAWISLDRPGYGIHGTPSPEQVGRTESHGCFRLANWDAEFFLKLVWIGMPVYVEP